MFYLIELLFFVVVIVFIVILINKKNKKNIKQIYDSFEIKQKEYDDKEERLQQERISMLTAQLMVLERDIEQKTQFNDSLLKIREEELERTLQLEKEKRLKAIEFELEKVKEDKTKLLNAQFEEFSTQQNVVQTAMKNETEEIKKELEDFRCRREAINQAIALENEQLEERDRHRIFLSIQDKEDIKYLLSIEDKINNKQLLRKLIWSEYLQKPFGELLKRLFKNNPPKNVIYCIENINNNKKYIGKTTAEVSKRWTEHIKTSLDIGTIKSQNIHKALYGHWEDFTFSVITETTKENISNDEKYYIKVFESDVYGYNMKSGG